MRAFVAPLAKGAGRLRVATDQGMPSSDPHVLPPVADFSQATHRRISGAGRRLPNAAGRPSRTRGTHQRKLDHVISRHGAPSEKRPHQQNDARNDRFGIYEDHAGNDRRLES